MASSPFADAGQAGLYHLPPSPHETLLDLANIAQRQLFVVDLRDLPDMPKLLRELGERLHFPTWYGANLDALHDCLCDPAWRKHHGTVLLLSGLAQWQGKKTPETLDALLDVLRSASQPQTGVTAPLWILLDESIPGVAPLPLA